MWFKSEKGNFTQTRIKSLTSKFHEFYDKSNQNKTQLESDVFELDDLLRVSIPNRWTSREKLKEIIDDIALDIIDKTNK